MPAHNQSLRKLELNDGGGPTMRMTTLSVTTMTTAGTCGGHDDGACRLWRLRVDAESNAKERDRESAECGGDEDAERGQDTTRDEKDKGKAEEVTVYRESLQRRREESRTRGTVWLTCFNRESLYQEIVYVPKMRQSLTSHRFELCGTERVIHVLLKNNHGSAGDSRHFPTALHYSPSSSVAMRKITGQSIHGHFDSKGHNLLNHGPPAHTPYANNAGSKRLDKVIALLEQSGGHGSRENAVVGSIVSGLGWSIFLSVLDHVYPAESAITVTGLSEFAEKLKEGTWLVGPDDLRFALSQLRRTYHAKLKQSDTEEDVSSPTELVETSGRVIRGVLWAFSRFWQGIDRYGNGIWARFEPARALSSGGLTATPTARHSRVVKREGVKTALSQDEKTHVQYDPPAGWCPPDGDEELESQGARDGCSTLTSHPRTQSESIPVAV
ncbi:hypothetical protein BV25DRAFT_1843006 [Artomyces pyxidatus]|uniref:Uncharacterized protein n=1 Tax=Artomyces pyxidatus TaxID=48021 RepID=A0ACB8SHY5_9AGAM|nr:hypothetical protein BV25DRAFT_1843006 [Artomyces pyxidatus]